MEYTLTDTVTGCSHGDSVKAEIIPGQKSFELPEAVCPNKGKLSLPASSEYDISWAGPGLEGDSLWSPLNAATGDNTLRYNLKDADTGCEALDSVDIEMLPLPDSGLEADPRTGEEPLTLDFEGKIANAVGRLMEEFSIKDGEKVLNTKTLKEGSYLIMLYDAEGKVYKRQVVKL